MTDGSAETEEDVAAARGATYRYLASALLRPPTQEALAAITASAADGFLVEALGDERLAHAFDAFGAAAEASLKDLSDEFHALFVVPGPRYCAPYESVQLRSTEKPLLGGAVSAALAGRYLESGFVWTPGGVELPDHLGVELSFLACLCEEEGVLQAKGDLEGLERVAKVQLSFVRDHLAPLGTAVASAMEQKSTMPYFLALAALLRAFLQVEAAPDREGLA